MQFAKSSNLVVQTEGHLTYLVPMNRNLESPRQ